ncbi:L,D-transpeptidase family protein [Isoalcanivorax indicus]|uniref:L,D-transpeptidase family protein n=1 Tax=Isoalcanivorax indicus TaxID=2202653 RepID=UPI000DB9AAB9|nr:L,D-transpeptidase family protein [Isoalcanivorax indicus]
MKSVPALVVLLGLWLIPTLAPAEVTERIRHRLEVLQAPGELEAGGERLYTAAVLQDFYEARGYRPIWFDEATPRRALTGLPAAIAAAHHEGLLPEHYHLAALESVLAQLASQPAGQRDSRVITDAELLASDAFLLLAKHYADGKVDPARVDPGWFLGREDTVLIPALEQAARGDVGTPASVLADRLPPQPAYAALRERLALQRSLSGEWTRVAEGPTLREGEHAERVEALRRRLIELADLTDEAVPDPRHFDAPLAAAVRRFQRRHGLEADAVVGARTLEALNVSPEARIEQLRVNMERWRWLPADLGNEHILVNIAGFFMTVMADGEEVMRQRVVVGRPYRRTPVFTGRMTYLVLNPSWEVPHSLAVQDQLPQIRRDPNYLHDMGFQVLRGWGAQEERVDPASVDWQALGPRQFPYRLRQSPGPRNALGQAKFMFPNQHNVYLHDTPARGLFAREDRAASSGCIRVSDPVGLAEWLLDGPGRPQVMSRERIRRTLDQGAETTVRLGRAVPVHLLYWTAWVEADGQVYYVRDVYDRDPAVRTALNEAPPR